MQDRHVVFSRLGTKIRAIAVLAILIHGCGSSSGSSSADARPEAAESDAPPSTDLATDQANAASEACTAYCDGIARTCAGHAQYNSGATCLAYCRFMPDGSASSPNTLACRAEALAKFEPARPTTSCLAAGPGGELSHAHPCGSPCATFCGMALRICPAVFADVAACMNACASFVDRPVYAVTDVDRNTYGCRLYYLTQAALQPDLHCAKVGADSPVCR